MANDPNPDFLPVKEENCCKAGKGASERIDRQLIVKLSRCELEDRVLCLIDEKTQLKKLLNCQEETIKRLRTKLQRLTTERKTKGTNRNDCGGNEELNLRLIELERENYTLKDRVTVLRQQLANHSRHITMHRSPLLSAHTSPVTSVRQSVPNQNEGLSGDQSSGNNGTSETHMRDADSHIKQLNEEIKLLHSKIEYLQQDLEKNSSNSRKTKVSENIELIRLQRSLKQQAVQIGTLQAQVKTSENNQKLLKEELSRAHSENDEAVNLITIKQNEILTLCAKLERKNLSRFEENELRETINDLMKERDTLKERSNFLIQKISLKAEEAQLVENLKRSLAEEKLKKEELETALKKTQTLLKNFQDSSGKGRGGGLAHDRTCCCRNRTGGTAALESVKSPLVLHENKESESFVGCRETRGLVKGGGTDIIKSESFVIHDNEGEFSASALISEEKADVETREVNGCSDRVKMELEMQYLRDMLRNQAALCTAQQTEIGRLMHELNVNEDKYNSTLRRLEYYLEHLEKSEGREVPEVKKTPRRERTHPDEKLELATAAAATATTTTIAATADLPDTTSKNLEDESAMMKETSEFDSEKRFVNQVFLESSDEEDANEEKLEKASLMKKLETLDRVSGEHPRKRSSDSLTPARISAEPQEKSKEQAEGKGTGHRGEEHVRARKTKPSRALTGRGKEEVVEVGIVWLQVDATSSVWKRDDIKLLFVDFSFLEMKGEETETPNSLPKPMFADEKCEFNFYKSIPMTDSNKKKLESSLNKPDLDLIVFKVVSDPEKSLDELECEDIGVAVVTVKQFLYNFNSGLFFLPVLNMNNCSEIIGKLAISIKVTPGLFNLTK